MHLNGRPENAIDTSFFSEHLNTIGTSVQINVDDLDLSKKEFTDAFEQYFKYMLTYYRTQGGRLPNQEDIKYVDSIAKSFVERARDLHCGLTFISVPITYFEFANRLRNPAPFSYAVLPKYDADIESIEAGSYREVVLSDLLAKAAGSSDQNLKAQLSALSAAQQTRTRTTLIGFGYQDITSVAVADSNVSAQQADNGGSAIPVAATQISDAKKGAGKSPVRHSTVPGFGWLIAPGRDIENDIDSIRFEPLEKSLSALISIPTWWNEIEVRVETNWLGTDETLEYPECKSEDYESPGGRVVPRCSKYRIRLPVDMQALDELIVKNSSRGPIIDVFDAPSVLNVAQCRPASIAIPGSRLWRSTAVTLGGQEATRIVVMPNMRGILAEFDQVQTSDPNPSLIVWTSVGSAKYPGEITLKGDDSCLKPKPQVKSDQ
jgi:hypothetical protein